MSLLNKQSKPFLLAQSMRPGSTVLPWILYSTVIVCNKGADVALLFLGSVLLICTYGIVTIQNDIADEPIDRLNKRKDIPLASKKLTINELTKLLFGLLTISIIVACLLGSLVLLWVGIYTFLGWLYSGPLNLKGKGYLALTTLGLSYGVMPWFLGVCVLHTSPSLALTAISLTSFIFVFGIISLKDFKDLAGDTTAKKQTILVTKGASFTHHLIVSCTFLAYVTVCAFLLFDKRAYVLFTIGIVFTLINTILLKNKDILTSARRRAASSQTARRLFFGYLIVVYAAATPFQ